MEEMGVEPIVSCTPNQHSPTVSAASGGERGDLMKPGSLPLAVLIVGECWLGVQDTMGSIPISSINGGGDISPTWSPTP